MLRAMSADAERASARMRGAVLLLMLLLRDADAPFSLSLMR